MPFTPSVGRGGVPTLNTSTPLATQTPPELRLLVRHNTGRGGTTLSVAYTKPPDNIHRTAFRPCIPAKTVHTQAWNATVFRVVSSNLSIHEQTTECVSYKNATDYTI